MTTVFAASIGGVVGSVLTAVANFFLQRQQDKRRWQREDRVSLQQDRLRIYREIIATLDLVQDGRSPYGEEFYAIREGTMPMVAEMKLISSDTVVNAAEEALSAAQYYHHLSLRNEYGEKVDAAGLDLEQRTQDFIECVREELGLPKGEPDPELVVTRWTTDS